MNKVVLLLAISSLFSNFILAQSSPEGMNYQAVARNSKGEILANQPIALKVVLFSMQSSGKNEYYSEKHDVITSVTGVFSLVVGKGSKESGLYENVPWAKENIWMEISIKSKGQTDFAVISNSKLLAVPYAYHALTAERLTTGSVANVSATGSPANNWILFGNRGSNPNQDKLGTTDSVDLVVVTNDLERLRIYANGNIFIKNNLRIGANLTVDSSAFLNKIGGATVNYGPFTVDRQSPTLLSGKLTVDKETDLNSSLNVDGITDLNSKLNVNNTSPSVLTGTLRVDGVTDINSALNVNNISSTLLSGTLQVNKDATFNEKIKILSTHQTDTSGAPASGALQVGGGAYIARNLYIGGIAKFGGPAAFGGAVTITDPSESVSTSTGALMIPYGGLGVGKRLNVGGGALLGSTLGVAGITSLTNVTQSTATNNGALVLTGGAGIAKNVNIGGSLTTTGIATINNTLNVNGSDSYIANFVNSTNANGISIQVAAPTPANANNFVTFRNSGGDVVGRIEGENSTELVNNDDYKVQKKSLDLAVSLATIDVVTGGIGVIMAGVDLAGASSSSTACAGLGVCVTAPVPSLIIAAGVNLATAIANEVSVAIGLSDANTQRNYFVSTAASNVGVTYQSGSGDYAEWLPKANASEKFKAGYVVGMKNGQISLNAAGADKLFVISTKPIVLGNMPQEGKETGYEKVAFMGQVPVFVVGKVNAGDYILPSGFNNGFAKAIAPAKMKASDYANIVGMAWSSSNNEGANMVNVAIGLNTGDISKVVAEQSKEISDLKAEINEIKSLVAKLASGTKETSTVKIDNVVKNPAVSVQGKDQHPVEFLKQDIGTVAYFDITTDQTTTMLEIAKKLFIENGGDVTTHPFWMRINSDLGYKDTIMNEIKKTFRNGMHTHQEINTKTNLLPRTDK